MKFALVSVLLLAVTVQAENPSAPPMEVIPVTNTQSSPILTALSQVENLKIRLRDIPALTFKAGKLATRTRTTPAQQLK